jgi:hypothetical protein
VRPDAPLVTELVVDCPFCGDKSFTETINGQYCLGHLESGTVQLTDMSTDIESTDDNKLLQRIHAKTCKGE